LPPGDSEAEFEYPETEGSERWMSEERKHPERERDASGFWREKHETLNTSNFPKALFLNMNVSVTEAT